MFREPQHRDYHRLNKFGDMDMVTAQPRSDSPPAMLSSGHGTIHSIAIGQITRTGRTTARVVFFSLETGVVRGSGVVITGSQLQASRGGRVYT